MDLSRKTNIKEAIDAGYSNDFMGVYAQEAIIGLPEKWFQQDGTTLGIFGRNLLIGTGGISGIIGLEAIASPGNPPALGDEMVFTFGKKDGNSPRKGFKIGFKEFYMKFQQNALIESSVQGSLTIPKFKQCVQQSGGGWQVQTGELKIDIEAFFQQNGDFKISAKPVGGLSFCLEPVFIVTINDLEAGRDDDKAFLCTSGAIRFDNNQVLNTFLKSPIEIKKLCIYSDGSFEFEAGSIPLPGSINMKLGPVEVQVTNMTFGSEERNGRKYNYFGFDCGVGVGAAGLDLRGDGIAYYFTTGGGAFDHFIRISGIGIDLVIPGTASKESAALIIEGYLSLKEEEYKGSIKFRLPKAGIAGGASMAMQPKVPAWVVDAFLEFSVPIPLAQTNLGIYGFRGLFGLRYIAAKQAIGLTDNDSWFDFYKKDVPPDGKGMHIGKMHVPDQTGGSNKPISIGAGLSLATASDDGKAFSLQAFFLISTPELIYIEGKANILGDRVGLTGDEPPFFAFVAFSVGKSVELGMGADYKQQEDGKLIDVHAEIQAAFFFQNKSAWFVHFGTKDKPITARILDLFNAYSYLMLSASGIEAGAGVDFGFKKKYGPVKASVAVYFDIWGKISFDRPQISAGIALGGHVDVSVFGIGLYFSIATVLEGTVPKPFRIHGSVELCVAVKLLVKKFEKCFDVEFTWLKNDNADMSAIYPLPQNLSAGKRTPVSAFHIGSGRTYDINYFGSTMPNATQIDKCIPLDSFVDLQFDKAVDASAVSDKIGFVTNGPVGNIENIPPQPSYKQVKHSYKIKGIKIEAQSSGSNWVDYHPYAALTPNAIIGTLPTNVNDLPIGTFQKMGKEYNKIRLLAQDPFSYLESSAGSFIPEQMGVTSSTLFCAEKKREWHCAKWAGQTVYPKTVFHHYQDMVFVIKNQDGQVLPFNNLFQIPESLMMPKGGRLEITLLEPSIAAKLKLFTYAPSVTIRFIAIDRTNFYPQENEVLTLNKNRLELFQTLEYFDENTPIEKIIIEPATIDASVALLLEMRIDNCQQQLYLASDEQERKALTEKLLLLETEYRQLKEKCCISDAASDGDMGALEEELVNCQQALEECQGSIPGLQILVNQACGNCQTLEPFLNHCLLSLEETCGEIEFQSCIQSLIPDPSVFDPTLLELLGKLTIHVENCKKDLGVEIKEVKEYLQGLLAECHQHCEEANQNLEDALAECQSLEDKIETITGYIQNAGEGGYVRPEGNGHCGTFIHEVCWLTEEDHFYNQTLPGQDAVNENFIQAQAAIENVVSPIWRPETTYRVEVQVSDTVNSTENSKTVYFGFKTKLPIGHFLEEDIPPTPKFKPDNPNASYDQKLEVPETSLKFYLDHQRSYPDTTGTILNRKPIFYKKPRIRLFYNRPYVFHFFADWPLFLSLPAKSGQLELSIKDPVEGASLSIVGDHTDSLFTIPPETVVSWQQDTDPVIPVGIEMLSNLHDPEILNPNYPGAHCWTSGGDPILPASMNTEIVAKHLKPLKLYTAVIKNKYEGISNEVHRYGFQTSRYGDFKEQVNSYHLKDEEGNERDAIFTVEVDMEKSGVSPQTNLNRAFDIVSGNLTNHNKQLAETFADPFQRLVEGHLALPALHAALNTEFNFIKDLDNDGVNNNTGKIFGLLIRNIEPFNDPKIPFSDPPTNPPNALRNSVTVLENGIPSFNYYPLFSKDRSQIFLMNTGKNITTNDLRIRFAYLEWNGYQYVEQQVVVTDNLIS